MADVLTTAATIECETKGLVTSVSTAKLKVAGKPVITPASVKDKPVAGCKGGQKTCKKVTAVTNTVARKLTVGGQAVLLSPLVGVTDVGTISATSSGSKLSAS